MTGSNYISLDLDSLLQSIQDIGAGIMRDQSEYAELVNKIYEENPPLCYHRPDTDETFGDEIGLIQDIIHHCLVVGNSKLLHDFVIDPINEDPHILTFSDSIQSYLDVFSECLDDAETETLRWYFSIVIGAFENAKMSVESESPILS